MRKWGLFILSFVFGYLTSIAQSSSCTNATAFCTSSGMNFPASTNAPGPSGANFGCLWTQPNPAFFFLQIANPGSITLSLSSAPANDIDFICWGPFTNPATMCNNLTAGNIEDCSYSPTWNETCQINNASVGDYYVILITNYSNSPCNINFSLSSGPGSTDCCIAGDAGIDNSINICQDDAVFIMETQLNGTPDNGGTWYNATWANTLNNNFDPSSWASGTYAYVTQGTPVAGTTGPCPGDTAYLTVNINPTPSINFPYISNICSDNTVINLNAATPVGGTYTGNGVTNNIFTPSINILGSNTITYTFTDISGCSNSATQTITVNEIPSPIISTTNASCNGYSNGTATITSSNTTISSYVWSNGQTSQTSTNLTAGSYGYTVTNTNGCTFSDSILIYEPGLITATLITTNISCNGGNDGSISVSLQGSSAPAGNVSLLPYCNSIPGNSNYSNIDNVTLVGDNYTISNNTSGICDQYEDYTNMFADITEGQPYTIDIALGVCNNGNPSWYPSAAKIFIDWNIDGDFTDPGEDVGSIANGTFNNSMTDTVPYTGVYGATRMRVVSQFQSANQTNPITSCDVGTFGLGSSYLEPWYGTTEDYSIVINSATITAYYLWNNLAIVDSIYNLTTGTYTVDITDQNGCIITESVILSEPSAVSVSSSITNISCNNGNNGAVALNISGGTPNYTISLPPFSQTLYNGLTSFSTPQVLNSGSYPYTITDSSGCQYNNTISLINPNQLSSISVVTTCDSYNWNGNTYTSSIIQLDTLTTQGGCDSLATLNLTITSSTTSTSSITECDSYTWNGNTYTASGNYDSLFVNVLGCDSLASLNLTINYSTSSLLNNISCDLYLWNNLTYTSSGIYTNTTTNTSGCTHTDSLILIINNSASLSAAISSCDSYMWNGANYSNSGTYIDTLTTSLGCDSIATLLLTITDTTSTFSSITLCDSYTWALTGQIYTTSLIDTVMSINSNGCPHIDSLELTIDYSNSTTDTLTSCDMYTWIDGNTYTASNNTATFLTTNYFGCDSTITLDLIINNSTSTFITDNSCNSYIWNGNNQTYTSSGIYTYTTTNTSGCTHTDTLSLFINSANSGSGTVNECDSYNWNGSLFTTTGIYTDTLVNIFGCDSIANLNLFISDTSYTTSKATQCISYNWSVNNNNYTSSGIYTAIGTNPTNGCVHIDSLILTINNPSFSYDTVTECDTYTWNGNTYAISGNYSITLTNAVGCDSIASLNLSISYSSSSNFSISECDNYTWEGTPYYTSGVYMKTLNTTDDCDSIVTLYLTIISGALNITSIISTINVDCFEGNNGAITLYPSGGIPPLSFLWGDGQTTQGISNLFAGTYTFRISDSLGCKFDSSITINEPDELIVNWQVTNNEICRNDSIEIKIDLINPLFDNYTVLLFDSINTTYSIDSSGTLYQAGSIFISPNFNQQIELISISDDNGCESFINEQIDITVNQLPVLSLNEEDICIGQPSYTLNKAVPVGGEYYIDNINTAFFDIEKLHVGPYLVRYEYTDSLTFCSNEIEAIIKINPTPKANFKYNPQTANILEPTINFIDMSDDITYSEWTLGDGTFILNEQSFFHSYQDTGDFLVNYAITNQYNCSDTTSKIVTIYPYFTSFIPSSFIPNSKYNLNRTFKPQTSGINSYTIRIYDTWGGLIFKGENKGWDGTQNGIDVQNGKYPYSITVIDFKNKPFNYTGVVMLIR